MAAEPPAAVRRWRPPSSVSTQVVGRRVAQGAIDLVASSAVPLLSLTLYLLVPVSYDESTVSITGLSVVSAIVVAVAILVPLWYWVIHPARQRGQTWGMRLLGVRVVRTNGLPVGAGPLFVRWVLLAVDGLAFGLVGLVVMLTSPRHQRLGDLAAGTLVVRDRG